MIWMLPNLLTAGKSLPSTLFHQLPLAKPRDCKVKPVGPISSLFSLFPPQGILLYNTLRVRHRVPQDFETQGVSKGHEVLYNKLFHKKQHLIDKISFSYSHRPYILIQRWPNQWMIKSFRISIYYIPVPPPLSLNCFQLFPGISPSQLTHSNSSAHPLPFATLCLSARSSERHRIMLWLPSQQQQSFGTQCQASNLLDYMWQK